jgi:hypothetical protein
MLRALMLLAVAVVALTSCGTPGAPQPPSLQLPQPPDDLTATRKGNTVTLGWTMSRETTDGATLRESKLGPTKICRGLANPLSTCAASTNNMLSANGSTIGQLPPDKTPIPQQERGAPKLTYTDTLTPQVGAGHETDFATYAVQILNSNGKAAGLSNEVKVPLAPVVSPPTEISASMEADGVRLRWFEPRLLLSRESFQQADRVMRRADNEANWTLLDTTGPLYYFSSVGTGTLDRSFQWEHTYYYKVTPITRVLKNGKVIAEVEGDDSPEVKVFTKDTFPPAQPSGVQAVFSGTGQKPFIDVTWAPNTEEDLAGYNVYRHEQGAAPQKINTELAKSPSFRDDNVQAGRTYFYSVSAVDLRNNESPKSEETSETVPK